MSPGDESTLLQFSVRTVVVALRCWWKVATPVALLLAIAAGFAVYFLHKPKYTADAWLLIKDKPDVILREVASDSQRFIQNQMEIIRSPRLLGPLASDPKIVSTPELRKEVDVTRALASRLKITPRGESDIYAVSFTSQSPEKAELIVREVVNAYLAFTRKVDSEQQNQIIRLLEDQREARYQEMTDLRETVRELSMQITGVDPFRAGNAAEEPSKLNAAMASLQADLIRYETAQAVVAAHIKAEEENQAKEEEEVELNEPETMKQIESNPSYVARREKIEEMKRKENEYARTGRSLSSNGVYRQLQNDIAAETKALDRFVSEMREQMKKSVERQHNWERAAKIKTLRAEYATGETRLKILRDNFERFMGTARQTTGDSLGLEFQKAKLEQVTKIHDEISARILAITTEQRAPERVMQFKEASLPKRPDATIPWKNIGMAAGASFFFPFALAILWEHFFRRVSCRSQVESANQIAVVGEVTALPSRYGRQIPTTRPSQRDYLLFEESVDSLRTYLDIVDGSCSSRVLAVTSAISGEGKTSLSSQLAVSIERATANPILVIDGDMRSPDVHERFNVPLSPGLAELLAGDCSIDEVIKPTCRENVFVIPAGTLSTSPHRLLKNGAFGRLLDDLRGRFGHVIVDTPPILPASEALVLARSADAAVICMRRDYSRLDQVQEAQARMAAGKVKTIGAVINGIPMSHYARKYGCYLYGRTA